MPEVILEEFNKLKREFDWLYAKYIEQQDREFMGLLPQEVHKEFWKKTFNTYDVQTSPNLDDLKDGDTYGKVLSDALQNALPLLSKAVGNLDDVSDGDIYGKVNITSISGGNILLAQAVGDLDDIANGTDYGKVALTSISAGKIVVAGLDSEVTARMFSDATTKTNMEAWKHTSDVTYIDGGKIYTGTITANQIDANAITAAKIATDAVESAKIKAGAVTATKIDVTSLSAITAVLGTVYSGTIYGTRIRVGGGTDEDLYFEDSGIRFYDLGNRVLRLYRSGYANLDFVFGTSGIFLGSSGDVSLRANTEILKLTMSGSVMLPNLGSEPTGVDGGICMVSGQLKYWNGTSWVNA